MTRARWITALILLSVLWLLGALVILPRLERKLAAAASATLSREPAIAPQAERLQVTFDGQQARLSGTVRSQQDRAAAEAAIRDGVRAPAPLGSSIGLSLNPVAQVLNDIEVLPFPTGWLLLAANGPRAKLLGTAANDYEARDLSRSVQDAWHARGGTSEGSIAADAQTHDEAVNVSLTLQSLPAPQTAVQAWIARIGEPWQQLTLASADESLRDDVRPHGISDSDWHQRVLPVLQEMRAAFHQQQKTETEKRTLALLPPGHLFIAARANHVILRGEVGSAEMKRAVLDEALGVFPALRVQDEIRVSAQRRPTGEFGPITTALLPSSKEKNGRTLFLSLSDDAWKPVDWQIAPAEQAWNEYLPGGFDRTGMRSDSAALSEWLQTPASELADASPPPAFLTLALFDSKVIISGQVAEASAHAQIIAAVRRAYAPRFLVVHDDLHLLAGCQAAPDIIHTLRSLPPPVARGQGILAVALPGSSWTLIPATRDLLEAGGLARSKQLPAGLSAILVEERSAEAIEQLRLWSSNLPPPVSTR